MRIADDDKEYDIADATRAVGEESVCRPAVVLQWDDVLLFQLGVDAVGFHLFLIGSK